MSGRASRSLPERIEPMLARLGEAFDSDEHRFEIKWDGFRTLVLVDEDGLRLQSRNGLDLRPRFPELSYLAALPRGVVLDGEIVILKEGRPSFEEMLRRERSRVSLTDKLPATYIAFDALYDDYHSLMGNALTRRLDSLSRIVESFGDRRLVQSDGVVGDGKAFFEQALKQDLEGVVAKRLQSRYEPGKRPDSWIKFKKSHTLQCAVIGYDPSGERDFRSLILAAHVDGSLRYVGKVGSGFTETSRGEILDLLRRRVRPDPLLDCGIDGIWVEPGIYCVVSYVERTPSGMLRAPVFRQMIVD